MGKDDDSNLAKPRTESDDNAEAVEKCVTTRPVEVNTGQNRRENQVEEWETEEGSHPEVRHSADKALARLGSHYKGNRPEQRGREENGCKCGDVYR